MKTESDKLGECSKCGTSFKPDRGFKPFGICFDCAIQLGTIAQATKQKRKEATDYWREKSERKENPFYTKWKDIG